MTTSDLLDLNGPAPATSQPTPDEALAARLYKQPPAPHRPAPAAGDVVAARADPARRLYSAQREHSRVPDPETRELLADLGLTARDVDVLREAERRAQKGHKSTVREREDLGRELAATYGTAARGLAVARALVARDPRTKALIDKLGIGDDVSVVKLLAERGHSQMMRGLLKPPRSKTA